MSPPEGPRVALSDWDVQGLVANCATLPLLPTCSSPDDESSLPSPVFFLAPNLFSATLSSFFCASFASFASLSPAELLLSTASTAKKHCGDVQMDKMKCF
jgi:hypothetical protein